MSARWSAAGRAFLSALGLFVLALLGWGGLSLYWHGRIHSALRAWEDESARVPSTERDLATSQELHVVLHAAGCRAFPALVDRLRDARDARFQAAYMNMINEQLCGAPGPHASWESKEWDERWGLNPDFPPADRERRMALFYAWWKENGPRYHQTWRVWSEWCLTE